MKAWSLRCYRIGIFIAIIALIHWSARQAAPEQDRDAPDVALEIVQIFYPSAAAVSPRSDARGAHVVTDTNGNGLGFFVVTSPDADSIIGYSGPSNVLVAFGADSSVLGVEVLSSGDTEEHLAQVVADPTFLAQFEGSSWDEIRALKQVDGVSGATLTSAAISEGILRRIAGKSPSLRFPKPLIINDAAPFFPTAASLKSGAVLDASGETIGHLTHSSPHSDNLIGYSGPSDVVIALAPDRNTIKGIALRDSYDSPQYTAYLDDRFLDLYDGMTLEQVLDAPDVEGVSGATMTSQTVAGAVKIAAQKMIAARETDVHDAKVRFSGHDIGTIVIILLALLMAFTKLRGNRRLRIAFQLLLIIYLGFMNGQLLSQALFVGWAQNGVAWQLAPGLLLLAAAAFLVPLFANRNLYCHQICPHGAAQQLLKKVTKKKLDVPPKLARVLRAIPFILLLFVIVIAVLQTGFNLAQIEPFDAYLWRAAGWATISVAVVGLIASMFVPMAYCRYGCPTGALLTFFWANGRPDKFSRRDGLALICLLLAAALCFSR